MDREAWQAAVYGITKSWTRLSDWTEHSTLRKGSFNNYIDNQSVLKEISPGCSLEGMMLSWNSSSLATSCEELIHWKRLWCWEGLGAGGEGDDRRWDGWIASPTQWTWVWVNSGRWWWTGRPGVLWFMGSQRVGHDWATKLNWTDVNRYYSRQIAVFELWKQCSPKL